ncbi:MAG: polysaccharide biosynthesis/export family protein [Myxococcota bacterium]
MRAQWQSDSDRQHDLREAAAVASTAPRPRSTRGGPRRGALRAIRHPLFGPLLWTLALLSSACSNLQPPPAAPTPEDYLVGPPDQLVIRVLPDPVIQTEVTVRPDGMISIELIGEVQAAGRTPSAIAQDIQTRISQYKRNASVTVSLALVASPTVTIFGQVQRPGVFALSRATRIAEAIGLQGGTTIFASKGGIRVIRTNGSETEILDVDLGAIQRGDLRTNVLLEQGDIIVVPANAFAKVGFVLQTLLFPFQPVVNTAGSVAGTAFLINGGN